MCLQVVAVCHRQPTLANGHVTATQDVTPGPGGEVRLALKELPPEQRAALLLVTVDGLTYKEAAAVAEVPVGTIMSRLARARVALQAKLNGGGRGSKDDAEAKR